MPSPASPSASSPFPEASSDGGLDTATVELDVVGMHCASCVALIEEVLTEQSGVTSAAVDLESARAVVGYTPSLLGVDDLRTAIRRIGYSATPVS